MDWRALLLSREKPVAVGLIGLGSFGLSFLRQSLHVPGMSVVALCDADGEGGLAAAEAAGLPRPTICETAAAAQRTLEQGQLPLLVDGVELPFPMLDAVVEASGAPEAGARHGEAALRNGCHLVLVNKETACTAGPALAALARANGLVYSMADGDQPAMVLEMVQWARVLGLDVVCAGKAGEADVPAASASADAGDSLAATVRNRSECIPLQQRVRVPDIAEMAIVINETGFGWSNPGLFGPAMHYVEMASILRHVDDGGLLASTPTVARQPDHPSPGTQHGGRSLHRDPGPGGGRLEPVGTQTSSYESGRAAHPPVASLSPAWPGDAAVRAGGGTIGRADEWPERCTPGGRGGPD
ncbi:MAG: hypothetical protein OXC13_01160 [Caldilineaceae bacterium]|nr:hypothetical protein [Caldilineaceae bacterium]